MLKTDVLTWLETRHGALLDFWRHGGAPPSARLVPHCDMIYALTLIGEPLHADAFSEFLRLAAGTGLPGWRSEGLKLSVHNCAYVLGALNLSGKRLGPLYDAVLRGRVLDLGSLVDPGTLRPRFPSQWAHHSWRVGHWIGGVPSIILSVAGSGSSWAPVFKGLLEPVRLGAEELVDGRTGLLRAYGSDFLQAIFRRLYRMRHDPELGDLGGTAHLLWFDHVLGRPYTGLPRLLAQAQEVFRRQRPFMEDVPYCLDFDIVQLVRTGLDQTATDRAADAERALEMMAVIEAFFAAPTEKYGLHKLPGALAAYHECALLVGVSPEGLGTAPFDIIKRAHWL